MAIPDGKPATDFSAMNREWVRAVAAEAASSGGGGIPAPENPSDGDVLTYDSTTSSWVAEAPSGGGGVLCIHLTYGESTTTMDKTYAEILAAYQAGYFVFVLDVEGNNYYSMLVTGIGPTEDVHDYNYVVIVGESDPMMYYCVTTADYPVYTS